MDKRCGDLGEKKRGLCETKSPVVRCVRTMTPEPKYLAKLYMNTT